VQLFERRALKVGDRLRTVSIFDTSLSVEIPGLSDYFGNRGVRAAVTGAGWITTRSQLVVDFDDPLTPRDGLQDLLLGQTSSRGG
jgi:proline racemase